jgi:hypothetical protein
MRTLIYTVAAALCGHVAPLHAGETLVFTPPNTLSVEAAQVAGGADPGGQAAKGKLLLLTKTPGGALDGRLIAVYTDANNAAGLVWHPKSGEHLAKDVFARYSDDQGATWSAPVNLSRTADKYSALTDWNGDGTATPYWGDSGKATVFSHGNNVVVSWVDKYGPESSWTFGDVGSSNIQGRVSYTDLGVPTEQREIPFSCVYVATSRDGGTSWLLGELNPPLQLTYGRRDAIQDVHRGIGDHWILTWQEDPLGLQEGEGHGPGTGYSGAKVSKGTDLWYAYTPDIAANPATLRTTRTPLSDNSVYDTTASNGFTLVGPAGSRSIQGGSRCNPRLVKDGGSFFAVLAYEESKGAPGLEIGKSVRYHTFPFDAPTAGGAADARFGDAGTVLSDPTENGRRVRLITQGVNGIDPAIVIFWRQGDQAQGAPADIMLKVSTSLAPASVAAAPTLNMSSNMPVATAADLLDDSSDDPLENALAHRGFLRGSTIVFGCSYTPDGALARYTDLANYNFYLRRSLDGGLTWLPTQNITAIIDTKVTVKEPRIVPTPNTGNQDQTVFVVAWGTETNVYEGLAVPERLGVEVRRALGSGAYFSYPVELGDAAHAEYESQFRLNEAGDEIFAVWMSDGSPVETLFATGTPVYVSESDGGFCVARPDAAFDPVLMVLLIGGVVVLLLRNRRQASWRSAA